MWQRRPRQPQPLPCPRNASLSTPQLSQPRPRRQRRLPSRNPPLHLPTQRVARRQLCPSRNRRLRTPMRGQPQPKPRLRFRVPRLSQTRHRRLRSRVLRLGLSRRRRPLRQACLPQPRPRGNRLFMPSPCRHLLRLSVTRLRIRLPRCQSRSMLRLANLRVEPCERQIVNRPLPSAKGKGKTKMTKARSLLTPVRRSVAVGFRRRSGPRLIMETLMWRRPRMRIRRHSPRPVRPRRRRRLTRSTRSHPCLRGRGRPHLDPDCNLQRSRRRASSSRHQSKPSCSL